MNDMEYTFDDFMQNEQQYENTTDKDVMPKDNVNVKLTLGITLLVFFLICAGLFWWVNKDANSTVKGIKETSITQTEEQEGTLDITDSSESQKGTEDSKTDVQNSKQQKKLLSVLPKEPALGEGKDFKATVTGKTVVTLDNNLLLYKIDFLILEEGKNSTTNLYAFLTKSSWDAVSQGDTLQVTIRIDNKSRFTLDRVVVDK